METTDMMDERLGKLILGSSGWSARKLDDNANRCVVIH
jgi:hypothetical protein